MFEREALAMSQRLLGLIAGIGVATCVVFSLPAGAQAPTLQEQLTAQYKLVKMGSDTGGYSVVDKGTLLKIEKGGILAVPYSDQSILSTKYENGTVHTPSNVLSKGIGFGMKRFGKEQTTHLMGVGDKVYPTHIDVNLQKDTVTLGIVACDTCNKTDPPTYMKANVVFQFAKGSLASGNAGQVEDTIGQLLSISNDDSQQAGDQGGQPQQQGADQTNQQPAAQEQAPAQEQQPQAEPANINVGMTPDQVEAALGKPDKKANLGAKMIYYYKDMKIIFMNGKVSDVQ
jgi:hypothetical protein